jgi:hypothetical protein
MYLGVRREADQVYPDVVSEGGRVYTSVKQGWPDIPIPDRRGIGLVNVVCM